jgi:hypothetical protein
LSASFFRHFIEKVQQVSEQLDKVPRQSAPRRDTNANGHNENCGVRKACFLMLHGKHGAMKTSPMSFEDVFAQLEAWGSENHRCEGSSSLFSRVRFMVVLEQIQSHVVPSSMGAYSQFLSFYLALA